MPSPAATELTRRHQRELAILAGLAGRQVRQIGARADLGDIDGWWDRRGPDVIRLVTRSFDIARALTTRYLRRHAAVEGVRLDPVRAVPNLDQITTSLRVMGPVAFKEHMAISDDPLSSLRVMESQLSGTAASRALDGNRDTFMATFQERPEIVGYRRVARPGACAFCLMLASRGAVYSKESADFKAHIPNCRCFPSPLYAHEDDPQDVVALRDQWDEVTAGLSGKAALRAFRRARAR